MAQIPADQAVIDQLNVSRETIDKLSEYLRLLVKWQASINLVSTSTLPQAWSRHVLDSAQLCEYLPAVEQASNASDLPHIVDVGSGAGFPGLVLSIMTGHQVTLVESDQRKSVFLKTVIRELGLSVQVENARIEALPPLGATIITARALAPIDRLLSMLACQLPSVQKCLFLKGASVQEELTHLQSYHNIKHRIFASVTSADSAILELDTTNHSETER